MNSFMVSRSNSEHPADELLLALIHEQSFDDAAAIRGHIAACTECTARSRELAAHDAEIASLLESLDHPMRKDRSNPAVALWTSSRLRRAALVAGAAATMTAAAAAMVPSSPLHRWITGESAAPAVTTAQPQRAVPAPAATVTTPAETPLASGIAIPAPAALIVVFQREQKTGTIEIARTASGDVTFRSRGGSTAYDVAEGQVSIDNQSPADSYLIDIPAGVQRVRIRIGTRTLIRWPEDSARFASPEHAGRVLVPLQPAASTTP